MTFWLLKNNGLLTPLRILQHWDGLRPTGANAKKLNERTSWRLFITGSHLEVYPMDFLEHMLGKEYVTCLSPTCFVLANLMLRIIQSCKDLTTTRCSNGAWTLWRCIFIYFILKTIPIQSMYGLFTYIWLIFMVNGGKYTIHGCYGIAMLGYERVLKLLLKIGFNGAWRWKPLCRRSTTHESRWESLCQYVVSFFLV